MEKRQRVSKLGMAKEAWRELRYGDAKNLLFEASEGKDDDAGEACYWLGLCYHQGALTMNVDHDKCLEYFQKSAELGHGKGMWQYGLLSDIDTANMWFKKAFESGSDLAKAKCYCYGKYIKRDKQKFIYYLTRAATQGDMEAQYDIGIQYLIGDDMEQNYSLSFEWHLKSAQQGYGTSQMAISRDYLIEKGTHKNALIAFKWYKKAAKQIPSFDDVKCSALFDYVIERENTRRAIYCLLATRTYCPTLLSVLPYDLVKLIVAELWETRSNISWKFNIDKIINE